MPNKNTPVEETIKNLVTAAKTIGVNVKALGRQKKDNRPIIRLEYQGKVEFLYGSRTPLNSFVATKLAFNKEFTKRALRSAGLKTPVGYQVSSFTDVQRLLRSKKLSFPLIIKPNDLYQGIGIMANLHTLKECRRAINNIRSIPEAKNAEILIERFYQGRDFRILATTKRVLAVAERVLPKITGDGKSTIKKLIQNWISSRKYKLKIDEEISNNVHKAGYEIGDILGEGEALTIRYNANVATGALCVNMTAKTHPFFKKLATDAVQAMGLRIGGVDILCPEIESKREDYVILEVNSDPEITTGHLYPDIGEPINLATEIIKEIFSI